MFARVFGISLTLGLSPISLQFAKAESIEAEGSYSRTVRKAAEASYDVWSYFVDPSLKCAQRSLEDESAALNGMSNPYRGGEPNSRSNEQRALARLAEERIPGLKCDLETAQRLTDKGRESQSFKDLSVLLEKIDELDRLWAEGRKKIEISSPASSTNMGLPEDRSKSLQKRRELMQPIEELGKARNFLISRIPLFDHPAVKREVHYWLQRHGEYGARTSGLSRELALGRLLGAFMHARDDVRSDISRMGRAAKNDGQGLSDIDINYLVKNPYLVSKVAGEKKDGPLIPLMCSLNRSYGKGQDLFDGALTAISLGLTGGAAAIGLSAKTAALVKGSASSSRLQSLAHSLSLSALGSDAVGVARSAIKCVDRTQTHQEKQEDTCEAANNGEIEFQTCIMNAVFRGAASALGRAGSKVRGIQK